LKAPTSLGALLVSFSVLAPSAAAADLTATWNNSTGNWSDATRWNTNPLFPNNVNGGFTFDAIINGGAVALDQNITIEALSLGGAITRAPATSFTLTLNGPFTWTGGTEGDHVLDIGVKLGGDGLWSVGGAGVLSVTSITEVDGSRTFTKTGAGTLATDLLVTGATNFNQGVFRGQISGTGPVTIASGARWHATDGSSSAPIALRGFPGGHFFSSLDKVGTGVTALSGPLTIEDDPNIRVEGGGELTLSGGIANGNNSGFGLFGPGELVLSGPGVGSMAANVQGGQLTIAHPAALGTGQAIVRDTSGGVSIPVLALAGGVTFASPITLDRATIAGLGNSTASSSIALTGTFARNNSLSVPLANNTLTLSGPITASPPVLLDGGHSLTKIGAGTVVLTGITTVSGGVTAAEGALVNNGAIAAGAANVTGNALLAGTGQFADVNVMDNGAFAPGASASTSAFSPAAIAVEDLVFGSSTTELLIQLGGAAPGSGHDQLIVSGAATLAGNLSVSLAVAFSLGASQEFLVLDVAGALSGQFVGLGEGALVGNFGGTDLFITYAAGDGNDVALFTAASAFGAADFDEDDDVDGDDLTRWRNNFGTGTAHMTGDADADGDADGADFLVWQSQLGGPPSVVATAAVPEPATHMLVIVAAVGIRRIGGRMRQEFVSA
jgi:hypothetical protein